MENKLATRNDAIQFARCLRDAILHSLSGSKRTFTGRTEGTRAIWTFLSGYASTQRPQWKIYPPSEPQLGRVAGEYLVDFTLFHPTLGCRVACESEWGDKGQIDWAFDKLRSIKADLKLLIFQWPHNPDGLPEELLNRFKEYLLYTHHHHPGHEFYLFIQFDKDEAKLFLWEPRSPKLDSKADILIESVD